MNQIQMINLEFLYLIRKQQLLMILFTKTQSVLSHYHHLCLFKNIYANSESKVPALSAVWTNHKYLRLIQDLRNPDFFQAIIKQQQSLIDQKTDLHPTFKSLRNGINHLTYLMRLKKWGHAYHSGVPQMKRGLDKAEKWLQLAFSERVNHTHENMKEEQSQNFEAINFNLYFELQERIPTYISLLYFNSYMHLLRDRWPLELMRAFQAIKESEVGQTQLMIIERSKDYLKQIVLNIEKSGGSKKCLNQIEAALIISYYKNRISEISEPMKKNLKTLLLSYLYASDDSFNSFTHLQNIVYILYLCTIDLTALPEVVQWLADKYNQHPQNVTSIYLAALFSHQDKITCLKVDIWASVIAYLGKQPQMSRQYRQLQDVGAQVIQQLNTLNFATWKYKYAVWMYSSIVNDLRLENDIVGSLQKAIVTYELAPHRLLSSFLSPFINYTYSQILPPKILQLESQVASWLSCQSPEALLTQPASVLCEVLPHADRHPALHVVYLPYLQKLLQLSLGRFQWAVLTQLYYYGLRWKAEESEEGYWRMQYVRRYIMNEYAVMGILRRQIPEDSYFYKIHEETTPERFYGNFSNH